MGFEEKYEHWRRTRAQVEVPGAFADRVMASIHRNKRQIWVSWLHKSKVAVVRSRTFRVIAATLALAVCAFRIGGMLAVFIPS